MNQIPSFPGSGSIWFTVELHTLMAGCSRTVGPTLLKLKGWLTPVTVYRRYEALLYMLHWPGCDWHQVYSCGTTYCASAKYVAPKFSDVFKSLTSTRIR